MRSRVQLKEDMRWNADLTTVVEVMKQMTATTLHQIEKYQVRFEQFSRALKEFFYWMDAKEVHHPFFESRVPARLFLLITSDAGFLGRLNALVVQIGLMDFDPTRGDGLAVVGGRGVARIMEEGHAPEAVFPGISTAIAREEIAAVKKFVVDSVVDGQFGSVWVIYPHYHSVTRQTVERLELFPCRAIPTAGPRPVAREAMFYVESPIDQTIAYLVELWAGERLYNLFWHSKLSELAARALHLEESFQELSRDKKKLAYLYFRLVHEETDRNIREIVAARSQFVQAAGEPQEVGPC